jgi:hypothetical protein
MNGCAALDFASDALSEPLCPYKREMQVSKGFFKSRDAKRGEPNKEGSLPPRWAAGVL